MALPVSGLFDTGLQSSPGTFYRPFVHVVWQFQIGIEPKKKI
jgi:hypothetical protein